MWTYPIDLVYNFYNIAATHEQRNMGFLCGLARVTSYSSRDLSKEGAKTVEKLWSDYTKPLMGSTTKRGNATQKGKMDTGNTAANNLFASGQFQAVKMDS